MGFYVMGKYQSVAWCPTREEAEKIAKQCNYRGGINWKVVEDTKENTNKWLLERKENQMTYRELRDYLNRLPNDQLNMDIAVYLKETDEYIPVDKIGVSEDDDVLDINHPYLVIDF